MKKKITYSDAKLCERNKHLSINLAYNNINELTTKSFAEECCAHELVLSKNPIRIVEPNLIAFLRVTTLSVDGYTLPDKVFKNLTLGVSILPLRDLTLDMPA